MKVKIKEPFFHQNKWFFPEDEVEGATAEAAVAEGCAKAPEAKPKTKKKSPASKARKKAPENK